MAAEGTADGCGWLRKVLRIRRKKEWMPISCPHCNALFKKNWNLNIHLNYRCPVLKLSAMSLVRVGRAEEREENGGTKKRSKSPRHYDDDDDMQSEDATQFEIDTAKDIFRRLSEGRIVDFKATYDIQVPVVQALLMDKFSKERLTYLRRKAEFKDVEDRFNLINNGFIQNNAAPTFAITNTTNTTAATSNTIGGMFGGIFNSQNINTSSNAKQKSLVSRVFFDAVIICFI